MGFPRELRLYEILAKHIPKTTWQSRECPPGRCAPASRMLRYSWNVTGGGSDAFPPPLRKRGGGDENNRSSVGFDDSSTAAYQGGYTTECSEARRGYLSGSKRQYHEVHEARGLGGDVPPLIGVRPRHLSDIAFGLWSVEQRRTLSAAEKEGESMMRHSETMRAASRLLLSHPIVCLLAALAAVVVLGVLGPIKVVHAGTVTPSATTSARLVGAGDIADIGNADVATGNLIDARPGVRVFTAGDNAYPNGSASDFINNYEPAWGPFKNRTSPSPGNHDYNTSGASAYKNYFGSVAGLRSVNPTYYVYTLGAWRVYALDSNISMKCGSPQYNFVQNDLATNGALCELAYWHHPIISSGQHGNNAVARPIFALFDAQGGDLVLNGHDHNYERFTKIDSLGRVSDSGVRQIIVGTGGTSLRGEGFVQIGSEVRNFDTHGIVDINLSSTGYTGTFVPAPGFGSFTDSFEGTCGTT